jgi:mono/diheme cytochrome c family protein
MRAAALLAALASLALAGTGCRDTRTDEVGGAVLYQRHCAPCHGASGRGDGPVADALTVRPPDLTRLAERAGGRFPEAEVMATIDGRRAVAVHGPREMPVWGAVFQDAHEEAGDRYPAYTTLLDARALTDHLRSIQR